MVWSCRFRKGHDGLPRRSLVDSVSAQRDLAPGLLVSAVLTLAAFGVAYWLGSWGVGAAASAVVLGILVGNLWPIGSAVRPGVAFVGKRVLTLAVVLLGLAVTFQDLLDVGWNVLIVVLIAVVGALAVASRLAPLFGVSSPLALLVGLGTGICGVSAIAAARGVVRAKEEDVSYAVAAVTFLGSLGLVLYPLAQLGWHPLYPAGYGVFAGSTLHSVPQAVGAAFAGGGSEAGGLATITKLSRVAMLGPMLLMMALWMGRGKGSVGAVKVPVEVWGFLTLFVLGSLVAVPDALQAWVGMLNRVLLVAALGALGLMTRLSDLRKAGVGPLLLALVTWVLLGGSVLWVLWGMG